MTHDDIVRNLVKTFQGGRTAATTPNRKERKPAPPPCVLARIDYGCRIMATGDLVRYTATGSPSGRLTNRLNALLGGLGDRCRPCCVWILAVGERDHAAFRERAGGLLTVVLEREVERMRTEKKGGQQ